MTLTSGAKLGPYEIKSAIGAGESRKLGRGGVVNLANVGWFPDGKHFLLQGSEEGQPIRTYKMDLAGGPPQAIDPSEFAGVAVSGDGKLVAGYLSDLQMAVLDLETRATQLVPGYQPGDHIEAWSEDGKAFLVSSAVPGAAKIYRVEVNGGQRALLKEVELDDKAGVSGPLRLVYSEPSKAYAYATRRVLGNLFVVEGLK